MLVKASDKPEGMISCSPATHRNTAIGRDSSSGDHNDLLRAGKNIGDILQLTAILFANLEDGHDAGKRDILAVDGILMTARRVSIR